MSSPRIDILMATYNGSKYIDEQIGSLQGQTYQRWTLLVSDDCSTDDTCDKVLSFSEQDERVKLVSHGKRYGGSAANFLSLLARSDAPYAMFCDQDDVWNSDKIARSLEAMRDLEGRYGADVPLLVSSDVEVVDAGLATIAPSLFGLEGISSETGLAHALVENNVIGCTMIVNRALVRLAKCHPQTDGVIMHDWWLSLLAQACGHSAVLNEPTMKYRQHEDNVAGTDRTSLFDVIRRFDLGRSASYWRDTLVQAQELLAVYSTDMRKTTRPVVERYVRLQREKGPANLIRIMKNGYLPTGAVRRLSQVLVYVLG